jgi:hypothetical protein
MSADHNPLDSFEQSRRRDGGAPLWAITTYFNPCRYTSRLRNLRQFRRTLNVPLVAVEWGHQGHFDLADADADIVVRATGADVLWQKERLLNLGLARLPAHVEYVAWLDSDVILERDDWAEDAVSRLRTHQIVQLFSELHDLSADEGPPMAGEGRPVTGHSIAHLLSTGALTTNDLDPAVYMRPRLMAFGLAWAARRSLMARHGFYDALVVGSGDRALSCTAYGRPDNPIVVTRMNACQKAHFLRWAEPFYHDVQGNVGCVGGRLYHLWHGDPKNRRYRERHEAFSAYAFDPEVDIVVNSSGAYDWADGRRDLAEFARSYFASRQEDAVCVG